ncbi:MAG: 4Fe-4S binding protein [Candidatus Ranarchaeia archaeon]|jgi:epoxyqueuosine reductase QueG
MTTLKAPFPDPAKIKPWNQEEFMAQFHRRATEGDPDLTKKCHEIAMKNGADLTGVGDARSSDWDYVQKGFRPVDYMPSATRIFALVSHRYDFPMDEGEMNLRVLCEEFLLSATRQRAMRSVAVFLEDEGYNVTLHGAGPGNDFQAWRIHQPLHAKEFKHFWWGSISEKHIQVSCGLGRMGVNNLFMTADFGPRVWGASFLTDAPLVPSPIWPEEICLEKKGIECGLCYEHCPVGAIHGDGAFDGPRCFTYGNEVYGVPLVYVYWKPCPSPCVTSCPVGNKHPRRSKTHHPYLKFPELKE